MVQVCISHLSKAFCFPLGQLFPWLVYCTKLVIFEPVCAPGRGDGQARLGPDAA